MSLQRYYVAAIHALSREAVRTNISLSSPNGSVQLELYWLTTKHDNRSVSFWFVHSECNTPEVHSKSEVFHSPAGSHGRSPTFGVDLPMGVLIYCYAMRSNRFNETWATSHLMLCLLSERDVDQVDIVQNDLSVVHGVRMQYMLVWPICATGRSGYD